jgi:preprotein translocase subunit YajC
MNALKSVYLLSLSLLTPITAFSQQAPAAPQSGGGGGLMSMLPMMILMFAIIYFFMIRPEQKKQKERSELLKNIKKGDKVLTAGGIIGAVTNVKETTVVVRIADNTNVEFTKSAVTNVIKEETEKGTEKEVK